MKSLASTVNGRIIQVNYYLELSVKYDAWNDPSNGHSKKIPIEILQPPKQIYTDSQSYSNWDPVVHPSVTLAEPDSE